MFKSIRLNKELRAAILSNIKDVYVVANPAPVVVDNVDTGICEAVVAHYIETHADVMELVTKFPDYVRKFSTIRGSLPDGTIHSYSLPTGVYTAYGDTYEFDYKQDANSTCNPTIPDTIADAVAQRAVQRKRIKAEREALSSWKDAQIAYMESVGQVVANVNTTGQLLTVWPEVERFLPTGAVDPSSIQLPSVNVAALNAALGA